MAETDNHTIEASFGLKGDVNEDDLIRANDAILTLRIAAGMMIPDEYQKWAADMNDDGGVKSNDAILILRKAIGLAAPGMDALMGTGGTATLMLVETHGVAGESVTVPLKVDNIGGLTGGDICIAYDSSVLRAIDVSSNAGILLANNLGEAGMVRIAFAGTGSLSNGILAEIQFNILTDNASPLEFKNVELYRPDALPMDSRKMDGRFISWAMPPENSALSQNYPNPFNPETWIPYELAEPASVVVDIYDAKGQLVRRLVLGHCPAGLYTSRTRAAYWDGRNEAGEYVASGAYFYTIQAGGFTATKKMVIAK